MESAKKLKDGKRTLLELLERRGIRDVAVMRAMEEVPREEFVGITLAEFAYDDSPLPIEEGQTISQPYIVALMTEAMKLRPEHKVLEIGTGSGYAAAVLSRVVKQVYTVERHRGLIHIAERRLHKLGYDNVEIRCGDGTQGWPEHAPFDAIVVTAGGPDVPRSLLEQLAIGCSLVIPAGTTQHLQKLLRVTRISKRETTTEELCDVRFVPLVGKEGWRDDEPQSGRDGASAKKSLSSFEPQDASNSGDAASKVKSRPRNAVPDNEADPEVTGSPITSDLETAEPTDKSASMNHRPKLKFNPKVLKAANHHDPLVQLISDEAQPLSSIQTGNLDGLLERIGDARLVLLGEASHGTAEFYEMRARISQELIEKKGFQFLAVEADWPDAAQIDHFIRDTRTAPTDEVTFSRFPTWMWANRQMLEFVQWLRKHNLDLLADNRVAFYGLDLYSLHSSINAVIGYLESIDKELAVVARKRYSCLSPWEKDPAIYGRLALSDEEHSCEREVVAMLHTLMQKRLDYSAHDGRKFLDAVSNARLVKDAEKYYRVMYEGSVSSWNLRDQHMFDTLDHLLNYHGPQSKAIIWAHNSHLGNANETEMHLRGEHNVGSLCREKFGDAAYLVGFGTHTGRVAAAEDWGAAMEIMNINPSHPESYEYLCHETGMPSFLLPLRHASDELREQLKHPRLERAIGVIYRPRTEMASHYSPASLPGQFDEYIWFDETRAVDALGPEAGEGVPETFPFGL